MNKTNNESFILKSLVWVVGSSCSKFLPKNSTYINLLLHCTRATRFISVE